MPKYLVLFLVPPSVMDEWETTAPEIRKPAEDAMQAAWGAWMGKHGAAVSGMEAGGKTKRVGADGVSDMRIDILLHCFVEAGSHDEAAQMFEAHPHLTIPQSAIEVVEVLPMGAGS